MEAIDLIRNAARSTKDKRNYEEKVEAVVAYTKATGITGSDPDPEAIDLIRDAARSTKAKRIYEEKVEAVMAYTKATGITGSDPEFNRLQGEAEEAHKKWLYDRQCQAMFRALAEEGRRQKQETLESERRVVNNHIDRLLRDGEEEDWYTAEHWGPIPARMRRAEQTYKEYEGVLSEFLPTAGRGRKHQYHLLECKLCGEIIIGRGTDQSRKRKTLARHNSWAHWTSN